MARRLRPGPTTHPRTLGSHPTCEEVVAVLPQLLGLGIEARSCGGKRGPATGAGLEGCAALRNTEDQHGVVLHVVEALNG